MPRLPITKTPKCFVGGAFIRSESNLTYPITGTSGTFFGNIPLCSRKDVRNAVSAAAKAGPTWAPRSCYNRGQILYRIGEMLEARHAELVAAHFPKSSAQKKQATLEVSATIDRIIHYAGWTDKYESLLQCKSRRIQSFQLLRHRAHGHRRSCRPRSLATPGPNLTHSTHHRQWKYSRRPCLRVLTLPSHTPWRNPLHQRPPRRRHQPPYREKLRYPTHLCHP